MGESARRADLNFEPEWLPAETINPNVYFNPHTGRDEVDDPDVVNSDENSEEDENAEASSLRVDVMVVSKTHEDLIQDLGHIFNLEALGGH